MTHTVRFQRVLRAPAERIYRAFIDPDAMAKWLPPHGFTGRVHKMDAHEGGHYRMSFTNLGNGQTHAWSGRFGEMNPGRRLVRQDTFDDPGLPGEMVTTVNFVPVAMGTLLQVEQAGIPDAIPAEACSLGWQESLALLALLVEAEIPA